MDQNLKKVKVRTVSEYDINEKDMLFPPSVKGFPGCMKMHQIVWNLDSPMVAVRKLSCTDKNCLYHVVNCSHMKHLGFYHLKNGCQKSLTVTPLADSKRHLREIGESFWTINNETDLNEEKIRKAKQTKGTHKEKGTRSSPQKDRIKHFTPNTNQKNTLTEEKGRRKDKEEQNIEPAEYVDLDDISEITFSRDGNKEFSFDCS